jgi:serine/threonine protein kinase/tetratricopeptide (TPR) repeat protein
MAGLEALVGQTISHYRITGKLGGGGMGVVYKAEDIHLRRDVALKLLPDELRNSEERRRRFWREAQTAAQVSHPNVCRVYDILEDGERLGLVMELVEGERLAERIALGSLPAQESAHLALNILSALEALHQSGIVHRDIKPDNIVVSPIGAKLLDFGIAKHVASNMAGATLLTAARTTVAGEFLGTPRYASPEQFRGEDVDGRSDIFSVGAVLFEMLTGQPPYAGKTFGEIAHAVLHAPPPALLGSPAIANIGRIVHTAMARSRDERYGSAEKMARELRAALLMEGIDTKAKVQTSRRLIVLPFRLMRPNQEIEFLCHSLPEAISSSLAELEHLTVRSSLAAARYGNEAPDLQEIGKGAEVDVILAGALLQVGEQLRLTTQLVEVPSGTLLWSHQSQATMKELLELHDDLVRRVVEAMLPSLGVREKAALKQDRPASPTVYRLYLQANEAARQWENLPAAIAMYEECLSLDPSYAAAWAQLGRARWLRDKYGFGAMEELQSAEAALQRAFRLSPNLPTAHHVYTNLQIDQGRTIEALVRLLECARVRRNDAELISGLGHVCRYSGLLSAALAAQQEAKRLDPQVATSLNHTYFMLGDYERALEHSELDFGYAKGLCLAMLGRTAEAVHFLQDKEGSQPWRLGRLYLTTLRALLEGKRAENSEATDELLKATFRDPEGLYYFARQLSYAGQREQALVLFRRAVEGGFCCYAAMVRDPWLDGLRAEREFSEILRMAHELHRKALQTFLDGGGEALLGVSMS